MGVEKMTDQKKPLERNQFEDIQQTFFNWHVYTGEYYWDDIVSVKYSYIGSSDEPNRQHFRKGPFLLQKAGADRKAPMFVEDDPNYRRIRPIEDYPELFRTFAETPATRKCILDFAEKYGMLTTEQCYVHNLDEIQRPPMFRYLDADKHEFTVRGESFLFWETEIRNMRWAVQLWDWLQESDEKSLQKIFFLADGKEFNKDFGCLGPSDEERIRYDYVDYWDVSYYAKDELCIYYVLTDKDISEQFSSPEEILNKAKDRTFSFRVGTIGPPIDNADLVPSIDFHFDGKFLLQRIINEQIRDSSVRPFLFQDEDNNMKLYLEPFDLLASLWVEFSLEVSGQKRFKRCAICGLWADVTKKRSNWTKHEDCANVARVQRFRGRQKEAETKKPTGKKSMKKPAKKAKPKAAKKPAGKKARGGK